MREMNEMRTGWSRDSREEHGSRCGSGQWFILCEDESPVSLALAEEAVTMTEETGLKVNVLVLRGDGKQCAGCGVSHVYTMGLAEDYADEAALADCLAEWFRERRPEVILAGATVRLRALMPGIAARLGCGLTADCTALELREDGSLLQIRPALGGNVMAGIVSRTRPQMATVRPGIFLHCRERPGIFCKQCEVEELRFDLRPLVKCLAYHRADRRNTLSEAEIIVAGGAGIGSREGFELLEQLAACLNGCVGASRNAVNLGYAPYSCQIGQTGQVVRPRIYLAVGISGAVQHVAGMKGAETVIAINKDRKAPVFDYADYGIVGDWKAIVEQLLGQISNET